MAASSQTQNFQLPQWAENDPILRADFNTAMATLDTTLKDLTPVIGSYVGNGLTTEEGGQVVELGFSPRFLLVTRGWDNMTTSVGNYTCVLMPGIACRSLALTETGFSAANLTNAGAPLLNIANVAYRYIALR